MKINFNGTNGKINFNGTNGVVHFGNPNKMVTPTILSIYQHYSISQSYYEIRARIYNYEPTDATLYYGNMNPPTNVEVTQGAGPVNVLLATTTAASNVNCWTYVSDPTYKPIDSDTAYASYSPTYRSTTNPTFTLSRVTVQDTESPFTKYEYLDATITNHDSEPCKIFTKYSQAADAYASIPTAAEITTLRGTVNPGQTLVWRNPYTPNWYARFSVKAYVPNEVDTEKYPESSVITQTFKGA